jgi:hypothetical protein
MNEVRGNVERVNRDGGLVAAAQADPVRGRLADHGE